MAVLSDDMDPDGMNLEMHNPLFATDTRPNPFEQSPSAVSAVAAANIGYATLARSPGEDNDHNAGGEGGNAVNLPGTGTGQVDTPDDHPSLGEGDVAADGPDVDIDTSRLHHNNMDNPEINEYLGIDASPATAVSAAHRRTVESHDDAPEEYLAIEPGAQDRTAQGRGQLRLNVHHTGEEEYLDLAGDSARRASVAANDDGDTEEYLDFNSDVHAAKVGFNPHAQSTIEALELPSEFFGRRQKNGPAGAAARGGENNLALGGTCAAVASEEYIALDSSVTSVPGADPEDYLAVNSEPQAEYLAMGPEGEHDNEYLAVNSPLHVYDATVAEADLGGDMYGSMYEEDLPQEEYVVVQGSWPQ